MTTPGGSATSSVEFKFVVTAPAVTTFAPTSGSTTGGTVVTVKGTHLGGVTAVTFGGKPAAKVTSDAFTKVVVTSPADTAGTVAIKVTTAGGSVTAPGKFRYFVSGPTIATFAPASGRPQAGPSSPSTAPTWPAPPR